MTELRSAEPRCQSAFICFKPPSATDRVLHFGALRAILLLLAWAIAVPVFGQSGVESSNSVQDGAQSPRPAVPRPPASGSTAPKPGDQSRETGPTYKVNVKLVNVFATVLDQNGAPVGNLKKENFKILEDGHPEEIAVFDRESQLPLSIILAVDTSLSTRKDLRLELDSARRFSHSIMRPIDRLSLYEFSETVQQVVGFTTDLKLIDRGINNIRVGAATAMYDAIYLGSEALERRQGRKVMVIITDGGDTVSKISYQEALRAAQEAEAIVYSIIIVPIAASAGRDLGGEHALIQISADTGGKYYYADTTDRLNEAFNRISDELRTQYLLAYYPAHRLADSDFRRIEVDVVGKDIAPSMTVRHRAGYYTSPSK
ncbi:MAG: VWA domain-containing protein [Terriglobales bacterium]